MTFIERTLLGDLKTWVDRREILAVKGPRQSGKTTLLKRLAEWLRDEKGVDEAHVVYVTLEDREQLDDMSQNPKDFVSRRLVDGRRHYLLVDEAQYLPDLGQRLKLVYDLFDNVKMVVTGSSSLELKRQTGRFLVGRML
ncbi:MAG: AAA family ATPase, partial [Nitrososphaerota archaeon]|nr:AAA family ATPase [Nitrososphaerota archaeon]